MKAEEMQVFYLWIFTLKLIKATKLLLQMHIFNNHHTHFLQILCFIKWYLKKRILGDFTNYKLLMYINIFNL